MHDGNKLQEHMSDIRPKIVFVFATAKVAGIEVAWRDIIRLIHAEYQIRIVIWGGYGPIVESYLQMGIPVDVLGADQGLLSAALKLFRLLRSGEHDAVITSGFYPDMVVRFLRGFFCIRYYVTLIPGLTTSVSVPKLRFWFLNIISGSVDCYLFNSENNASLFHKYPRVRDKVKVMKLGIEYLPDKTVMEWNVSRDRTSSGIFRLICVANMLPVKNHIFLVNLFDAMRDQLNNVQLVFVGKGPLKSGLQVTCRQRNIPGITFCENVPKVNDLLATSDAFIFASHFEGTPMAIMEAMNAGLPVIAYQGEPYSGVNELVKDGKTGELLDSFDMESWISAIQRLQDDKEYRLLMGQGGRNVVQPYKLSRVSLEAKQMIDRWIHVSP